MFNKFCSDCRYMLQLRRHSPTKLCEGAKMAIFCVLYFQRAACSTFQTCILNSHYTATPCVEVWQTSNLRPLRLGEERKKPRQKRLRFSMFADTARITNVRIITVARVSLQRQRKTVIFWSCYFFYYSRPRQRKTVIFWSCYLFFYLFF